MAKECIELIGDIKDAWRDVVLTIRLELIKTKNEAFKIKQSLEGGK